MDKFIDRITTIFLMGIMMPLIIVSGIIYVVRYRRKI
jgi:hypothetical protein